MAGDDKTESATPKRRDEARKKGNVPKSSDLASIFVLLGVVLALGSLVGGAGHVVQVYFESIFGNLDKTQLTTHDVMTLGGQAFLTLGKAVGPLMLTALALGVFINIAQTGPVWAGEALKPNFNRLNPLTGAQRFVSSRALVELIKSLYKIGIIAYIAYITIQSSYPQMLAMARLDLMQSVTLIGEVTYRMVTRIVMTMLVLAALDYAYQRYAYEKSLRMTKQEVKDEFKQAEGNPQFKARIRARQREIAKKRMMSEVPTADVVITNPTHFAVALKYDATTMRAPLVVAKGQDLLALKIREVAQENDVPIVENAPLARALYKQVNLGKEVSSDLYEAVAEVLAFVYLVNQRRRERMGLHVS